MKKIITLLLCLIMIITALTACNKAPNSNDMLNSEIEALKNEINELKKETSELKNEAYELVFDIMELEDDSAFLQSEATAAKTESAAAKAEIDALKTEIEELNRKINSLSYKTTELFEFEKEAVREMTASLKLEIIALKNAIAELSSDGSEDDNKDPTESNNGSELFKNYDTVLKLYAGLIDCVWEYRSTGVDTTDIYLTEALNETEKAWCTETYHAMLYERSYHGDDKSEFKKTYGYAIHDLNNDGINELILLKDNYYLLAIYTTNQNGPVLARSCQNMDWIDENGYIHQAVNGAKTGNISTWELRGTELVLIKEIGLWDDCYMKLEGMPTVTITSEELDYALYTEHFPFDSGMEYTKIMSGLKFIPLFGE